MGGESVGSCPPNIFSMADRANIVVEPGVSLVLMLKLCMLMLLFKKFSDFAQSLLESRTYVQRSADVSPCMT